MALMAYINVMTITESYLRIVIVLFFSSSICFFSFFIAHFVKRLWFIDVSVGMPSSCWCFVHYRMMDSRMTDSLKISTESHPDPSSISAITAHIFLNQPSRPSAPSFGSHLIMNANYKFSVCNEQSHFWPFRKNLLRRWPRSTWRKKKIVKKPNQLPLCLSILLKFDWSIIYVRRRVMAFL